MATHAGVVRAAPKPNNWWRCNDCGAQGKLSALLRDKCETPDAAKSKESRLLAAVMGKDEDV